MLVSQTLSPYLSYDVLFIIILKKKKKFVFWRAFKNSGIFENMTFYGSKKSEIVDFVDLTSTVLVCNASICPIYMLMTHIWSPHKCILRQSMCTHAAQKKNFINFVFFRVIQKFLTICAFWVYILKFFFDKIYMKYICLTY